MSNYTDFIKVGSSVRAGGGSNKYLRVGYVSVKNGTNASTLKCEMLGGWQGDTIDATDNVAKNTTTGYWTLSSDGTELKIENSGLSDYVRIAWGNMYLNDTGTEILFLIDHGGGDLRIRMRQTSNAAFHDITSLVDSGDIYFMVYYITGE